MIFRNLCSPDHLLESQWIKKYFETHYGGHPYDALERRGGASAGSTISKENTAKPNTAAPAVKTRPAARIAARDVSNTTAAPPSARPTSAVPAMAGANKADENRRLQEELTSLKFTVEKVSSLLFVVRSAGWSRRQPHSAK